MDTELTTLATLVAASLVIAGTLAIIINGYFRLRRRRLLGGQSASQLRRSAEHIHLVAQACHTHTGNVAIGRALHQLAVQTLENALRLDPRDSQSERLLREYQEREREALVQLSGDVPSSDDQAELSRARLLLTEALRMLGQIERDGWVEPAELAQMRNNLHQARRAVDLRLRLRHAAQPTETERWRRDPEPAEAADNFQPARP